MKYLLAFALVAVAAAVDPARLLRPVQLAQPDIAPLMVPQEVMDQVAQIKIVDAPEVAPVDAVKIVDAPVQVDASDVAASVDAVKIVDAPVQEASDFAVNFVDTVPEVAEIPTADFAVNFVDNADVDEESPSYIPSEIFQVRIVEIPLPDSVVMPFAEVVVPEPVNIAEAPVESNPDFGVKFVDVAEETPLRPTLMRPKQYPNPMWR